MLSLPVAPRGSRKDWKAEAVKLPPDLKARVLEWGTSEGYATRQEALLAIVERFLTPNGPFRAVRTMNRRKANNGVRSGRDRREDPDADRRIPRLPRRADDRDPAA